MIQPSLSFPGISVWDNLIDDDFLLRKDRESNFYSWSLTNIANNNSFPNSQKGSHLIWGSILNKGNDLEKDYKDLLQFCVNKLIKKNFKVTEVSMNGQSYGQDGTCHTDVYGGGEEKSLMIFLNNRWQKEWGGEFQILENKSNDSKVLYNIEYVPGRIVYFDASLPHRGLAPKVTNVFRKSLIYRLEVV